RAVDADRRPRGRRCGGDAARRATGTGGPRKRVGGPGGRGGRRAPGRGRGQDGVPPCRGGRDLVEFRRDPRDPARRPGGRRTGRQGRRGRRSPPAPGPGRAAPRRRRDQGVLFRRSPRPGPRPAVTRGRRLRTARSPVPPSTAVVAPGTRSPPPVPATARCTCVPATVNQGEFLPECAALPHARGAPVVRPGERPVL